MELWQESMSSNTNNRFSNTNIIKKFLCFGCCIYIILLIAMIAILESDLPWFKDEKIKQIIAIALGLLSVIILAIILFGMLFVMQKRMAVREKWRDRFVNYLCAYITELKQHYPNLTFSVIYPMNIYSRRVKTSPAITNEKRRLNDNCNNNNMEIKDGNVYISAIWCYLRVSEGSIITSDNEPIYESTNISMRKDSDYSRVTGITSAFSLNIEDDSKSIVAMNTMKNASSTNGMNGKNGKNNNNKKLSKQGSVNHGGFPVLAKKMGYKQLT